MKVAFHLLLAGFLIATLVNNLIADPPVRVDRFGDPLPEGAVMRLGTIRFRVPGLAGVGFRPSGELVAIASDLTLHTWPADGSPMPSVTRLSDERSSRRLALSANA